MIDNILLSEKFLSSFRSEMDAYSVRFGKSDLEDLIDSLSMRYTEEIIGFLPCIMVAMLKNIQSGIYSSNAEMIYYLLNGNGNDIELNKRSEIIFNSLSSIQKECVFEFLKFFHDLKIERYAQNDLASCVEYWSAANK